MSETNKKLLIGDMAVLTGIPQSTLRFWENQGIAEPEKDGRNQYRRYTPDDSCRFLFAKKYRSFGVPLPDIPGLFSAPPSGREAALAARRGEMAEEMRLLSSAMADLDRHLAECARARSLVGRFEAGKAPERHFFNCVERGGLREPSASYPHEWLRRLPGVDFAVRLDPGHPRDGKSFSCGWGFAVDAERFAGMPESAKRGTEPFAERSCLATAVLRSSARDFSEEEYAALVEGMEKAGAALGGLILGHILEIDVSGPSPRYLILLFLPIKE